MLFLLIGYIRSGQCNGIKTLIVIRYVFMIGKHSAICSKQPQFITGVQNRFGFVVIYPLISIQRRKRIVIESVLVYNRKSFCRGKRIYRNVCLAIETSNRNRSYGLSFPQSTHQIKR